MSSSQLPQGKPPPKKDFDVDSFNRSLIGQHTKTAMGKAFYEIRLGGKINPKEETEVWTGAYAIKRHMAKSNSNWQYLMYESVRYKSFLKHVKKLAGQDLLS